MQLLVEDTGMVSPGILDCTNASALPDEEHFGPLLKVFRFADFDQALVAANNTNFGLSAGLLSDNAELIPKVFTAHSSWASSIGIDLLLERALLRHLAASVAVVITELAPITRQIIAHIR
ncbi:MAG: aldehyde dehydrogenase family protein [Rheinheimera sp.]|nr:aldehyde dehydrogenase family protein [Rheinheimera sp.]